ncbi:MAG: hypothetical protein FJ095_00750 [Deltaproteobacteria bacterium]|nr:hypothetical protein [Deltaproteobacteria bacterium]
MSVRATIVAVLVTLSATAVTGESRATPSSAEDKAAAETLFQEGLRLKTAGQYLDAARKFEQVQKLDPGIGNLLHLAQSYELAGRFASAWGNYAEAAAIARRDRDSREKLASDLASKLAPKLARLTIDLGPNATLEGLVVTRGGIAFNAATASVALPVDAGTVVVEVSAPGYAPHREEVALRDAEQKSITIPALTPQPPTPTAEPVTTTPKRPTMRPEATPVPEPNPRASALRVGALAAGVAALASAGVAVGFSVRAVGLDDEASALCSTPTCTSQEAVDRSNEAFVAADVATATTIAAGVLGATSLGLMFGSIFAAAKSPSVGLSIAPWLDGRTAGAVVGGAW